MKTCKFFLQGTCRNGNNCRFSHETFGNGDGSSNRNSTGFGSQSQSPFGTNGNNIQGVTMTESGRTLAIEELQHPPIWPLSGFAVTKGLPSIVTGDVSCEESRWEAYQELKTSGNCRQCIQKFQALAAEQQTRRQRVVSLLENRQLAQKLFSGEPLPEAGGFGGKTGVTNPFGGGTPASPFGGASSSFGGTTSVASPFGSGAAAPASSPFGNAAPPAASPFGGGNNSTTFGGAAANPFGGGSSTTAFRAPSAVGAGGGAGFGGSAPANPFGGASAPFSFGNSSTTATPLFETPSTSTFGGAATPSSSPFGGGVSVAASPFGNGASAPTVAFNGGGAGSGFAGIGGDAAKSASSPFGGSATAPASSPSGVPSVTTTFGGIAGATSSLNPFSNALSSNNATATPFGEFSSGFNSSSGSTTGATNHFASSFAVPSSSPIGASTTSTSAGSAAGGFGNSSVCCGSSAPISTAPPTPAINGPPPDVRDDAWNAKQFQQAEFSLGMVPTVPPPPQFC